MRCSKNELLVKDPEAGQFPSTYWSGDKWLCPKCGHEVITGFGKEMILKADGVPGTKAQPSQPDDAFEFSWNVTDIEHKG
jgi:hypothetical protein